jgi:uncharacterized protein YdbL (DUF1318 family)
MSRWITTAIGTAALALAACVTINVYFPAAAAKGKEQSALPPGKGSMLLAAVRSAVEFVIPAANAQADLDVSTPAIRAVTASMESRHGQLEKYYTSGAVGLTADGLVEIRDANAVPLAERNVVRKLVADENADRNSLYREIASGNGHPEWETDIRNTFASRWIAKARGGWWYRNAAGNWVQK